MYVYMMYIPSNVFILSNVERHLLLFTCYFTNFSYQLDDSIVYRMTGLTIAVVRIFYIWIDNNGLRCSLGRLQYNDKDTKCSNDQQQKDTCNRQCSNRER